MFEAANDCFASHSHQWMNHLIESVPLIHHCFGSSAWSHDTGWISQNGTWGPGKVIFSVLDASLLSDCTWNKYDAMMVAHQYLFNLHINTWLWGEPFADECFCAPL